MKSIRTAAAAFLLAGIALSPLASVQATAQTASRPTFSASATGQTMGRQAPMPWGRYSSIPPFYTPNGGYRPNYGLYKSGN